ncbi:hypothetical protein F8M41_009604 [Gigaspora margarita]|uniref:Uncharacterized protein n=1 Tax=Gigaspora margarita TaxID=4874 RepID=A0A8H4EQG1_GIGMA|nr:hypothetical protein F8M41_009604 [Gigaspora margarita]
MILKVFDIHENNAMVFSGHYSYEAYSSPMEGQYLFSKALLIPLKSYCSFSGNLYINYKSDEYKELDILAVDSSKSNLTQKSLNSTSQLFISNKIFQKKNNNFEFEFKISKFFQKLYNQSLKGITLLPGSKIAAKEVMN